MKKNEYLNEGVMDSELAAEQEEIKSRRFKYGTLATVFTAVFIVAVVIINIFIGEMTSRFVLEIDLTADRLFEISEDTKEVIAGLNEDILITVLAEETTYRDSTELLSNIYEVLQRYESLAGGKITVRYVNPTLNPTVVAQYNTLGNILSNDIIIESDRRFKKYSPNNLYSAETDQSTGTTYYVGLRAEQRITSALLFVTSEEIAKAAYVIGHGETTSVVELDSLLNYSNYEVTTIRLLSEEITDDVSLLIINDPQTDFYEQEIDKLDSFFQRGGKAIVTLGPNQMVHPKLDVYFEEWGVKVTSQLVFDSVESLAGYPHYILPNCLSYEGITANLNLRNQRVMVVAARAIELTGTQTGSHTVTPLMSTSSNAYAKTYEEMMTGITFAKTEEDIPGPFYVTVMSERLVSDKSMNYIRSSILFASPGMITDSVLKENAFLNRTYLGSTLNYMADFSEGVVIPDKTFSSKVLTITSGQARVVFWVIVIGIPLIIIACGVFVWARRRHL